MPIKFHISIVNLKDSQLISSINPANKFISSHVFRLGSNVMERRNATANSERVTIATHRASKILKCKFSSEQNKTSTLAHSAIPHLRYLHNSVSPTNFVGSSSFEGHDKMQYKMP